MRGQNIQQNFRVRRKWDKKHISCYVQQSENVSELRKSFFLYWETLWKGHLLHSIESRSMASLQYRNSHARWCLVFGVKTVKCEFIETSKLLFFFSEFTTAFLALALNINLWEYFSISPIPVFYLPTLDIYVAENFSLLESFFWTVFVYRHRIQEHDTLWIILCMFHGNLMKFLLPLWASCGAREENQSPIQNQEDEKNL